jgi:hypothetical protein
MRLDAEVQRLLTETGRQYEEYLRLAKLTDLSKLAVAPVEPPSPPSAEMPLQLVFSA